MLKTADEIFNLLKEQKIESFDGDITLNLMGISVRICDKSAIGYVFQEWFSRWLDKNKIDYKVNKNSQKFPDFFLLPDQTTKGLLEIKTFDLDASANFDVANFEAYCRSLTTDAYRLDADYLIFGYTFNDGILKIERVWLKKIWEITSPSELYPVKTQVKQNVIYNIRPCTWDSKRSTYKPFKSKEEFVFALAQTLKKYPKTSSSAEQWLDIVSKNYYHWKNKQLKTEALYQPL